MGATNVFYRGAPSRHTAWRMGGGASRVKSAIQPDNGASTQPAREGQAAQSAQAGQPARATRPPPPPRRTPQQNQRNKDRPPSRAPKNGFFSDVDPNATLYPVRGSLKQDPTKRSGNRYESDFVWNSNWKDALDYNDTLVEREREKKSRTVDGRTGATTSGEGVEENDRTTGKPAVGRISLVQTRQDLNSMDIDLTAQLLRKKEDASSPASQAPSIPTIQVIKRQTTQGDTTAQRKTQRESRAWSRSARYGSKPVAPSNATLEQEELELEDQQAYDELKAQLYLWTIGLTTVCMGAAVTFYGRDIAASYGVGALAGFLYLRSLSRSVDSFGSGLGGAGSPRLLIPVILAAGYNRYNTLVAEETGLYLSLLPMLVGFFTYKVAVVGKQGIDLFDDIFQRQK